MTTNKEAPVQGGQEITSPGILDRTRSTSKWLVVTLALWGFLPYRVADWAMRSLRLRGA